MTGEYVRRVLRGLRAINPGIRVGGHDIVHRHAGHDRALQRHGSTLLSKPKEIIRGDAIKVLGFAPRESRVYSIYIYIFRARDGRVVTM